MTQLLISVTSVNEAQIALENGADIIDLKDPGGGALGALPLATVAEVVEFVSQHDRQGKKNTSATIGDLPMEPQLISERVMAMSKTKVDIIKIGFFGEIDGMPVDYQACLNQLEPVIRDGAKLIAVLFAEHEYPAGLIAAISNAGFYGLMLDTANKNGATFLDYFSKDRAEAFSESIQAPGLRFGLAGSLALQHVASVKALNPDYIGFRGGVCAGNRRTSRLDAGKIAAIRKIM